MRYHLMMLAGAGLLSLTACKKEAATPEKPQQPISNEIIPLKIGNNWTYRYDLITDPDPNQIPDIPFTWIKFEVKKRITRADFPYPDEPYLNIVDKYDWYYMDRSSSLGGLVLCNAAPNLVLILSDFPFSARVDTFIYNTDKDEEILSTKEFSYAKFIKAAYGKTVDANGYSSKLYAELILGKPDGIEINNSARRYYQRGLGLTMLSTVISSNRTYINSQRFLLVNYELK